MQLSEIFIIKNQQGLFKAIELFNGGLMVESLVDGKRLPVTDASDDAFCIEEIELHGTKNSICLNQIFKRMLDQNMEPERLLQADVKEVKDYFRTAVPEIDQSRVFSSDMRKIVGWFGLLKDKIDFDVAVTQH